MSWPRGQDEINAMLDSGELGRITADLDLAKHLIAEARRHVKSAEVLASADPSLAYAALHDAIRKSLAEDEIRDEIPYASAIVEAAAKAIDHLPVYTAWSAKESDA